MKNCLGKASHNLETTEISIYKNAFDLAGIPFVLINDKLQIIDINSCAKDLLQIKLNPETTENSLLILCETSKLAGILNAKGTLETNHPIQYDNQFVKWKLIYIFINNIPHSVLLGIDASESENILNTLQAQAKNTIGYINPRKSDENQMLNNTLIKFLIIINQL